MTSKFRSERKGKKRKRERKKEREARKRERETRKPNSISPLTSLELISHKCEE
jgi:hypothetical protein